MRAAYLLPFVFGCLFACSPAAQDAEDPQTPKPNILFIFVDDLGWKDLGVYGSDVYETPHIDELARQGMRFTNAYAAAAVCSPTRASLLTGTYPARVGITDWIPGRTSRDYEPLRAPEDLDHLPHSDTTLAETLRQNGYDTHFIGKWHLGGEGSLPTDHGFMTNVGGNAMGNPGSEGFFSPYNITNIVDTVEGEYLTERLTDEALQVIDGADDDPFFLLMSYYTVHRPLQAPDSLIAYYKERIDARRFTNPAFVVEQNPDMPEYGRTSWEEKQSWGQNEALFSQDGFNDRRATRIKRRQNHPVFAAMVHYLDYSVGRLLTRLESRGLEEETIVVFYSDNGGLASEYRGAATSAAPLRTGKGWLYEGGIRVPLIVRWPGHVTAGTENASLISSPDFYPTLLEMTGLPFRTSQHTDGSSFWTALSEQRELTDRTLYWHWPHYSNHGQQSPGGAVRRGRYKLIEYYEHGTRQLFDLEVDLQERENLVDERPALADSLGRLLQRWRESVAARMPAPNPAYDQ